MLGELTPKPCLMGAVNRGGAVLGELTPKPCLMGVVLVLASLLVPPILGKSCLLPLAPPVVVSSTPPLLACSCPFTPWLTLVVVGLVLATAPCHRQ
jgi:hypothetical protein